MDRLYRTLAQFSKFRPRQDDDLLDRAHYAYTTILLITFSIVVSTKQYVGEPIVCWCPAHFTSSHQRYTNHICWIANTYWLPISENIPQSIPAREDKEITYYQWVPFLLLAQAIAFYVPCLVWRSMNNHSGISVKSIVEVALDSHTLNPESRHKIVKYLSRHIELCLENQREHRTGCSVRLRHFMSRVCCLFCGRRYGNYLLFLYMTVKSLYTLNTLGQLIMMKHFLDTRYHFYGLEVVKDLVMNRDWRASGMFPRVTMCDFEIRTLGNIHRHTVQCVLPINMFNEKMFIFLWWWFVILLICTVINYAKWITASVVREARFNLMKKYLSIFGNYKKSDKLLLQRFVHDYLRYDGIFLYRLISNNAGDVIVSEIANAMWHNFKNKPGIKEVAQTFELADGKANLI